MNAILVWMQNHIFDLIIYAAIATVTIIGFVKCVFSVSGIQKALRKAIKKITSNSAQMKDASDTPLWQNPHFLGRKLENAWHRFLNNARQLDARGLTCNVDDYINDDTTIYAVGHVQLSEIIPGLLTSLGILGTFVGLVTGLSGLSFSNAAGTKELQSSVFGMIDGMKTAFSTSIAGVSCSLLFNIMCKSTTGKAIKALDDFQDVFADIIMQRPVDDSVRMIIQQEDQGLLLRNAMGDVTYQLSQGISTTISQSLVPVIQQINEFIMGRTQSQLDGLGVIVQAFVGEMSTALGSNLYTMGQSLERSVESLHNAYTDFTNGFGENMSRSMLLFDENMTKVLDTLSARIGDYERAVRVTNPKLLSNEIDTEGIVKVVSNLQKAVEDATAVLQAGGVKEKEA